MSGFSQRHTAWPREEYSAPLGLIYRVRQLGVSCGPIRTGSRQRYPTGCSTMAKANYQFSACFDPEGDYEGFELSHPSTGEPGTTWPSANEVGASAAGA